MPIFKKNSQEKSNKKSSPTLFQKASLLQTEAIIKLSKEGGADFGTGNANERIRYFIKLGLLPHTVRKIPALPTGRPSTIYHLPSTPIGHLPYWCVERLIKITSLNKKGLTFPQIAKKLKQESQAVQSPLIEPPTPKPITPETLLPTKEVIKLAKKEGADLGSGDAGERIRYFVKLGLVSHAVRRTTNKSSGTVGHLPYSAVTRLIEITNLNKKGLTFPQIAEKIKNEAQISQTLTPQQPTIEQPASKPAPAENAPQVVKVSLLDYPQSKDIEKTLKQHEDRLASLIDKKLNNQAQISVAYSAPEELPKFTFPKTVTRAAFVLIVFSLLSGTVFIGQKGYQRLSGSKATKQVAQDFAASGQVLAASSANHRLYIDADSEFSGTTLFKENITAPNIIYSVRAGTGIAVSAGQNPTVSLDTTAIVPSVNSASGPITLKGSGSTTISNSGGTITISSSSSSSGITSEADTLGTVTGRGATTATATSFTGGATVGTSLTLSAFSSNGGILYTNGSGVAQQVTAGTASQCLLGGTTPSFGSCASGGVASLDGLTGALTISNSSGLGTTITIDDATTVAKGIASFSSSYFSVASGAVSIKTGGVSSTEILDATIAGGDLASNITISTSSNISTTGSGTITSAGLLTASNGFTLTTGALNITATSGALTLSGLSASSISTGANALTITSSNFNTTATGINSTAIGATTASTGAFTTLSATPGSTNDITLTTDSDSTIVITGLASAAGTSSLCLDGTNNVITCAAGGVGSGDITSVVAGAGLTGGGTSGDVTLDIGAGTGITVNANDVAIDTSVVATLTGSQTLTNKTISGASNTITNIGNSSLTNSSITFAADVGSSATSLGSTRTIAGTSAQGITTSESLGTVTITAANAAADGSTKGVAAFNSTNFSASTGVVNTIQNIATTSSPTFANLTLGTGGALRTGTTDTNTALLQAYDVDGTAYTTFGTLTAGNTPTFDLASAVTIGSAYIYRAGGTDVPVTDGGTGASTSQGAINTLSQLTTEGDLLYHNGTNSTRFARGSNGTCLTSNTTTIAWGSCAAAGTVTAPSTQSANQVAYFTADDTLAGSNNFTWDGSTLAINGTFTDTLTTTNKATFASSTANSDTIQIQPQSSSVSTTFNGIITSLDITGSDKTWSFPNETGTVCTTGSVCSGYQASGTYVTSVSGTTDRISSTGGTTPVIDIAATYVGQSSITTTGALTSGSIASGFGTIATANTISTSSNISTTGSGTITSAGLLTGSAGSSFSGGNDIFTLGAANYVQIDASSTPNTTTAGVLDINVNTATNNNRGIDLSYSWNNAASAETGYGIFSSISRDTSTVAFNNKLYGQYLTLIDTVTGSAGTNIGQATVVTIDGATSTQRATYGDYISSTLTGATSSSQDNFGIYSLATSDTGGIDQTAYGIYAEGKNGDHNYGVYTTASGGTTNYAIYAAAGNVNIQGLTASKGVFTDANKNLTSTGTLGVSQGGTGLTTFGGTNTLLYTSTADNLTNLANGTTGQCLTATTSSAPSWGSCAGTGVIGGSGTSGQIAFFNGTSSITSESSGFGWDTTNKVMAITTTTNTTTTGVLDINVTSATDNNRGIDLNYTYSNTAASTNGYGTFSTITHSNTTNANTLYGQYLTLTDATTLANTNFGSAIYLVPTGNAAKTNYGTYTYVGAATSTGEASYGSYTKIEANTAFLSGTNITTGQYVWSDAGAPDGMFDTTISYGIRVTSNSDDSTSAGTGLSYGIYIQNIGGDTLYGLFVDNPTTITNQANNYAIYVANQTEGNTSDYGLYLAGADTETIHTEAGIITHKLGAADYVKIDASTTEHTTAGGVLDINVDVSGGAAFSGIDLNFTGGSTVNTQYAMYISTTKQATAGSGNLYSLFTEYTNSNAINFNDIGAYHGITNTAALTSGNKASYGVFSNVSSTGTNTTGLTTSAYGVYSLVTATQLHASGTSLAYGGIFSATSTTTGTGTAYGVYANASGGTNNYPGIFMGGNVGIGTTTPAVNLSIATTLQTIGGMLITASDSHWVRLGPSFAATSFNPLTTAGDSLLSYSNGTIDTGGLVIAPWSSCSSGCGIRMDASGNVGIADASPNALFDIDAATTTTAGFGITDTGVHTGTGVNSVAFITANSLTTGTGLGMTGNGLSSGTLMDLSSTSTAGTASGSSYLLKLARSGANSNTAHNAYGVYSSVVNTNVTSGTNIAGYFTASGATTANYGLYVNQGNSVFNGSQDGALASFATNANTLPAIRAYHSSVVANGYVYVIGGFGVSTVYYAKLNADGSTGTFATNANALPAISSVHSSVVANGYVYVIGGFNGSTYQSTVYYAKLNADGSTGTWSTNANALPAIRGTQSSVVANGYVYAIGGNNATTYQSTVYYAQLNADGSTGTFATNANALPAIRGQHSSVVANGYVYVIGGYDGSTDQSTVYYAQLNADGSTDTFSTNANALPAIRSYFSSVVANGYVYAIGGNVVSTAQSTVYYASTARVSMAANLDLLGLTAGQLTGASSDFSLGSAGGSIFAGNIFSGGNLEVTGNTQLWSGLSVSGTTSINSVQTEGAITNIVDNSLTTGTLLNITSTSTAGTADTSDYGIQITRSGANAGATHTAYGISSSVTNTGTTNTNYAAYLTASGGTTANYALYASAGTAAFLDDVYVGATTEGITNAGFVVGGDDFYVEGMAGIKGNIYTNGSFITGATTTYADGSINQGTNTSFDLLNTVSTTINFGGAATTALNIGNGSGNYTDISIGSGAGTHAINIAGTGATAADTINIGTGGTGADTITIGNNASTTSLAFTSGTGAQTFTSSVVSGTGTTSAFVLQDTALTSGTGIYGNFSQSLAANAVHLNVTSTASTAVTQYGTYANWANSTALAADVSPTFYGLYQTVSKSGTDGTDTNDSDDITNFFALSGIASNTAATSGGDANNVRNTYGGYFSATGSAAGTDTTNAYGIYATASGADTNYGIFSTGADLANVFTATASTTTTGVLDINVTSATTLNHGIDLNYTYSNADASTTGYGTYSALTHSNSTNANNLIGSYIKIADSIALANTNIGLSIFNLMDGVNTSGNKIATGLKIDVNAGNASGASASETAYGIYLNSTTLLATGNGQQTANTYGIFVQTNKGDNAYGLYLAAPTGASNLVNTYGIYMDNWNTGSNFSYGLYTRSVSASQSGEAIHTEGGNITHKLLETDYVNIDGSTTTNETTSGVLYVKTSSSTTGNIGLYGDYTSTNSAANDSQYGIYSSFINATASVSDINQNVDYYGVYALTKKSGADGTTGYGTHDVFGITSDAQNTSSQNGSVPFYTRNTYGGYFSATGAGAGITNTYGIYASASGGDNNYPIYMGTAPPTANNAALCWDNATDSAIYDCNGSPADLAENYGTQDQTISAGDLVIQSGEAIEVPDPHEGKSTSKAYMVKSSAPYQNVLGVISTNPNLVFGEDGLFDPSENPHPVSLAGRVPVKVNTENGPINPGDLLTSSSNPGVAMKADPTRGSTIGTALSSYTGTGTGSVIMIVETSARYNLAQALQNTDLTANSFSTTSSNTTIDTFGNITTSGNVVTGGILSAAGGLFTVDSSGNMQANSLNANLLNARLLNISGDANIGGQLSAQSILTSNIQSLQSTDLSISLGDAAGSNSLKLLDSIGNLILQIDSLGNADFAGTVQADAFVTHSTADLAEAFPTSDNSVEAADIVSVDPDNKEHIQLSNRTYDPTILGVISTEPGFTLNANQLDARFLALAGRVPVKVNLENGPISAGDPITSSSTPGIGMKATQAGRVIGIALEPFDTFDTCDTCDTSKKIVVFVNPSWYTGTSLAANGSINQPTSEKDLLALRSFSEGGALGATTNPDGTLTAPDEQLTMSDEQVKEYIDRQVDERIDSLIATGRLMPTSYGQPQPEAGRPLDEQITAPVPTTIVLGESTASASTNHELPTTNQTEASTAATIKEGTQIASETQKTLDTMNNLLSTMDLKLDTLSITGPSNLAQTQVAGTFSQDGTFVIDYGHQLNVLGSTLFLQNDIFAGSDQGVLVDIGAGSVIIDKNGNLQTKGTITAQNIQTKEITIDTSDVNAKTVGSANIASGKQSITIFTTALKPNAKVLLTPTGPTGGKTLYVANKSDFEGFTVALDGGKTANTIQFDWLIINNTQISQNKI